MRNSRLPSLLVSAVLHLALFLAAYVTWPMWSKPIQFSEAVPVTIVSRGPSADVRPAEQAERAQTAAAPEPVPEAAPVPPAPAPAPEPKPAAPPKPQPAPKPEPTPKPAPSPPKPKPDTLNLNALAASKIKPTKGARDSSALDLSALAAGGPKSRAAKGPARPETDLLARLAVGRAASLSGDALSALQSKLNRLWNPNCEVEGGANVQVRVEMKIGPTGFLLGEPSLVSQAGSGVSPGVIEASAQRALSAVKQGEPYTEIPRDAPHDIILRFNAKQACGR
jgi:outer membrane biosynthesis protein TonB